MRRALFHAAGIAAALGACALLLTCRGGEELPRGRALVIGIDGATLDVAGPLLEAGRLPNLERIADEGVAGPLKSLRPLVSPRIWTTVATGKTPRAHGIHSWMTPPRSGESRLYVSTDRKTHALWNIASDAGLVVGVVNWLVTYPPERLRGVMVSDHALPGSSRGRDFIETLFTQRKPEPRSEADVEKTEAQPVTYPLEWEEKVDAIVAEEKSITPVPNPFKSATLPKWIFRRSLSNFYAQDQWLTRIALAVEAEIQPDLLMVLLQGIDRSSHFLWGTLEPAEKSPLGRGEVAG